MFTLIDYIARDSMPFKAPRLELDQKRRIEVPFMGNVGAGLQQTFVSSPIPYRFRVLLAKMVFQSGTTGLVRQYWLVSSNSSGSMTGTPSGTNIFGREAPTGYFASDGVIKRANVNLVINDINQYIKLHVNNTSGVAFVVDSTLTIQQV